MKRRSRVDSESGYVVGTKDDPVPLPVVLWQEAVHKPGIYDLEVDTSLLSPEECAEVIGQRLMEGPPGTTFRQLAELT
jgi:chloramphenicol 3-O phosphotransferase